MIGEMVMLVGSESTEGAGRGGEIDILDSGAGEGFAAEEGP